ncbi:MAG: DoxX family protein [Chloroflexota bacterium]
MFASTPGSSLRLRRWAPPFLATLFAGSGVLHLVRPDVFLPLIPTGLPGPVRDSIVLCSGVAELVCATGLLTRAPWAGMASAVLLILVFPGNIKVAIDATSDPASSSLAVIAAWARLPLQAPLIWAALQARPAKVGPDPRLP